MVGSPRAVCRPVAERARRLGSQGQFIMDRVEDAGSGARVIVQGAYLGTEFVARNSHSTPRTVRTPVAERPFQTTNSNFPQSRASQVRRRVVDDDATINTKDTASVHAPVPDAEAEKKGSLL